MRKEGWQGHKHVSKQFHSNLKLGLSISIVYYVPSKEEEYACFSFTWENPLIKYQITTDVLKGADSQNIVLRPR